MRPSLWLLLFAALAGIVYLVLASSSDGPATEGDGTAEPDADTTLVAAEPQAKLSTRAQAERPPAAVEVPARGNDDYDPGPVKGFTETFRGRVLGPEGEVIPGVLLQVRLIEPRRNVVPAGKRSGGVSVGALNGLKLETDAEGGFVVRDVNFMGGVAEIRFLRVPEAYLLPNAQRFPLTGEDVNLTLEHAQTISGRVVLDPRRPEPQSRGWISAHWLEEGARRSAVCEMDELGRFRLGNLPAETRVTLIARVVYLPAGVIVGRGGRRRSRRWAEPAPFIFRPSAVVTDVPTGRQAVEIRLEDAFACRLTAIDGEGGAIARKPFTVTALDAPTLPPSVFLSDEQGQIRITGLPRGSYGLKFGYPQKPGDLQISRRAVHRVRLPSEPRRLAFPVLPRRRLRGQLIGTGTVGGFRVSVHPARATGRGPAQHVVLVDDEGWFDLDLLEGLHYDLHVERFGDDRSAHRRGVTTDTTDLRLTLEVGSTISGRILDVDGEPINFEGWAEALSVEVHVRAAFAAGGRFAFHGLPPGRYVIRCGGVGTTLRGELRDVEAGSRDVVLRIPAGGGPR